MHECRKSESKERAFFSQRVCVRARELQRERERVRGGGGGGRRRSDNEIHYRSEARVGVVCAVVAGDVVAVVIIIVIRI